MCFVWSSGFSRSSRSGSGFLSSSPKPVGQHRLKSFQWKQKGEGRDPGKTHWSRKWWRVRFSWSTFKAHFFFFTAFRGRRTEETHCFRAPSELKCGVEVVPRGLVVLELECFVSHNSLLRAPFSSRPLLSFTALALSLPFLSTNKAQRKCFPSGFKILGNTKHLLGRKLRMVVLYIYVLVR